MKVASFQAFLTPRRCARCLRRKGFMPGRCFRPPTSSRIYHHSSFELRFGHLGRKPCLLQLRFRSSIQFDAFRRRIDTPTSLSNRCMYTVIIGIGFRGIIWNYIVMIRSPRKSICNHLSPYITASSLLGGSWVVISGVLSRVIIVITHISRLINPM